MESQRLVPCNYCRQKHLKCNDENPCTHCSKLQQDCIRTKKRYRFSKTKRLDASLGFSDDQTWVQTKNPETLAFIDVTPKKVRNGRPREQPGRKDVQPVSSEPVESDSLSINAAPAEGMECIQDDPGDNSFETTVAGDGQGEGVGLVIPRMEEPNSMPPPSSNSLARQTSHTSYISAPVETQVAWSPNMSFSNLAHLSPTARSEGGLNIMAATPREWQSAAGAIISPSAASSSALVHHYATSPLDTALQNRVPSTALRGLPDGISEAAYLQLREACLMRHYVENLAPWFDTSDRDRHYTLVVPHRAMFCPVLLYAIYTASARHLTRLWHKRNPGRVVEFDGIQLHGLDDHTAIHYHNKCINYLIEISNDPAQSYNEDALTAATILRFYEQIDTPLTGQDSETYLNVVRAVVETQQDEAFYSIRKIHGPVRDVDPYIPVAVSLRHSACLIALRQEIWSVLLYRRPIQLPINPSNDFELLVDPPPADDFVWANRIFVWTADVLKFCFGGMEIRRPEGTSNNPSPSLNVDSKSRVDHWNALKRFELTWQLQQPASFRPLFYRGADLSENRVFPEIWLNNEVQVLALQHFEIASLLLSVYDPRQPRLGLEALTAHRNLAAQIQKATLTVCGLAVSNKRCPPALVDAAVAISMCGSYFEERTKQEQDALVEFLEQLELEHAWPTGSVVIALREAWNEGTPRSRVF